MKSKMLLNDNGQRVYAVIFDSGDEVINGLTSFAKDMELTASQFTAVGALCRATLGYFDWDKKDYTKIPVDEQVEVLTLAGDVTIEEGEPKIHAHVVVGKSDGTAHGGHVLEAYVRPTLEVILEEMPEHLRRTMNEEAHLALISI